MSNLIPFSFVSIHAPAQGATHSDKQIEQWYWNAAGRNAVLQAMTAHEVRQVHAGRG